jgi:hypothetical protein
MLKVAVVTDGPYGDRAFEKMNEIFNTSFIKLEQPPSMFLDEIEVPDKDLNLLEDANIPIIYKTHPDLTLELVDTLHNKVD